MHMPQTGLALCKVWTVFCNSEVGLSGSYLLTFTRVLNNDFKTAPVGNRHMYIKSVVKLNDQVKYASIFDDRSRSTAYPYEDTTRKYRLLGYLKSKIIVAVSV